MDPNSDLIVGNCLISSFLTSSRVALEDDKVGIAGLLSKRYAESQRARIDPKRAAVSEGERHNPERLPQQITDGHPAKFADEQTTHFACADAAGTVVSVTQTLGVPFGSGFAVPGTGVVLNNILKWMDRDAASPNVVRSGRKAGTMMSPTQVYRDGAFALSIGSAAARRHWHTQSAAPGRRRRR